MANIIDTSKHLLDTAMAVVPVAVDSVKNHLTAVRDTSVINIYNQIKLPEESTTSWLDVLKNSTPIIVAIFGAIIALLQARSNILASTRVKVIDELRNLISHYVENLTELNQIKARDLHYKKRYEKLKGGNGSMLEIDAALKIKNESFIKLQSQMNKTYGIVERINLYLDKDELMQYRLSHILKYAFMLVQKRQVLESFNLNDHIREIRVSTEIVLDMEMKKLHKITLFQMKKVIIEQSTDAKKEAIKSEYPIPITITVPVTVDTKQLRVENTDEKDNKQV
jgi:hypothetical protein